MAGFKKSLTTLAFRMKLRRALQNETQECLMITLEETKKEIERRNKKNGK